MIDELSDPAGGESYAIVKSGQLAVTLKTRRNANDSSVLDRQLLFGRGDVISEDTLLAIGAGAEFRAVNHGEKRCEPL